MITQIVKIHFNVFSMLYDHFWTSGFFGKLDFRTPKYTYIGASFLGKP